MTHSPPILGSSFAPCPPRQLVSSQSGARGAKKKNHAFQCPLLYGCSASSPNYSCVELLNMHGHVSERIIPSSPNCSCVELLNMHGHVSERIMWRACPCPDVPHAPIGRHACPWSRGLVNSQSMPHAPDRPPCLPLFIWPSKLPKMMNDRGYAGPLVTLSPQLASSLAARAAMLLG